MGLKFEHTKVFNFEGAIRGMRNPMDSWDRGDSMKTEVGFLLGDKDLNLARRLIKAGVEHRKFLRQIIVSVDITAPRFWWIEFDTYTIGVSKNSCSTMHKLISRELTKDDFTPLVEQHTIDYLNSVIREYQKEKSSFLFRVLKENLPEGYLQKRTLTLNYEVIFKMVKERENHRLKEWSVDFVKWTESLPYFSELTMGL